MKFILSSIILFQALIGICQNSCYGPKGFDATYYYIDSTNNHWLGTGSSGGIFLKSNDNTWIAKNDPFGPAHISWIGTYHNKLITIADNKHYQYDYKCEKWSEIKNLDTITEILHLKERSKKGNNEILMTNNAYKNIKVPLQYNFIFPGITDKLIICSNFGLFQYNIKSTKIVQLKSNLVASDVYQIEKSEDAFFCLTNDYKIWRYSKNNWREIFSLQNYLKDSFFHETLSFDSLNGLDKSGIYKNGFFSVNRDTILYTLNNSIYKINLKNSLVQKILPPNDLNIIESYYKNDTLNAIQIVNVEMNYIKYKVLKYSNGNWTVNTTIHDSNSLPIFNNNPNSLRTNIVKFYKNSRLKFNFEYNLFEFKNEFNEKILSYFFDKDYLYLGTSGSGLIKINLL